MPTANPNPLDGPPGGFPPKRMSASTPTDWIFSQPVDKVIAILLPVYGWSRCKPGDFSLTGGTRVHFELVPDRGSDVVVAGPVSSILAVEVGG